MRSITRFKMHALICLLALLAFSGSVSAQSIRTVNGSIFFQLPGASLALTASNLVRLSWRPEVGEKFQVMCGLFSDSVSEIDLNLL